MTTQTAEQRYGLSPTQALALGTTGNLALVAGAGSGKTRTLTALVARDIVDTQIAPEDILVCTFTRAAAANVTALIEQRIRDLDPRRAGEATLRMMCGTIDAICQRLVQERALELGISVSLSPGDERVLKPLRTQAALTVLADLDTHEAAALRSAFSPMPGRLGDEIQQFHEHALRLRVDINALTVPTADPPTQSDIVHVMTTIQTILADGRANDRATTSLEADLALLSAGRVMETRGKPGRVVGDLSDLLTAAKAGMLDLKQRTIDAQLRPAALAIAKSLRLYHQRYSALKRHEGIADYTDMAENALRLATLAHPRHFMRVYVDEAQDTSPLQMQVLRSLVSPGGALIPVGDANQSIYGFRDADVGVFLDVVRSPEMEHTTLDENYRSQTPVLTAINAISARIFNQPGDRLVRMLPKADPTDPPRTPPSIDVVYALGEGRQMPAQDEARLAVPAILNRARDLDLGLSDIAVLCPTNLYLGIYSAEFRRRGIPNLALQSGGLLARPECQDILSYLLLLADPSDQSAFTRVVTSPIAGLSAAEVLSILKPLRLSRTERDAGVRPPPAMDTIALTNPQLFSAHQRVAALVGRVSVAALARAVVQEHQLDLALEAADPTGAQLRNVERLVQAIGQVEARVTGPSIIDILHRLPDDNENVDLRVPAGVDAVRLMTIYGAKGLEFPLVAITRLSWSPPTERGRVLAGRDGSVGVSHHGMHTSALINARDERNAAQADERRRVAYVGITRAKEHLMLIGSGYVTTKDELSWAGMARMILKEALEITEPLDPGHTATITVPGAPDAPVRITRLDPANPPPPPIPPVATHDAPEPAPDAHEHDTTHPQPMATGAISYSHLEKWRKCGLRRYLERDLGLQPLGDRTSADTTGEDTLTAGDPDRDGRDFGHLVHETLEHVNWHQGLDLNQTMADAEQREATRPHPRLLTDGDRQRLRACLDRAATHLIAAQLMHATTVQTEVPFATLIAGQLITGVIDVLATLPDGTALIVDWKTGEHFHDHADDYDLQRRIYSLALLEMEGGPTTVEARWLHLEGEGHEQVRSSDGASLDVLRDQLAADITTALTAPAVNAVATPDERCQGCPGLKRVCPLAPLRPAHAGDLTTGTALQAAGS